MCGITGYFAPSGRQVQDELRSAVQRMADTLHHRGPDDHGVWTDGEAQVALGHRRLSIIDLTPDGHQPMTSADGRWVLIFNGEIYNHAAIRQVESVHGYPFRGRSDTEVLLASLSRRGLRDTLMDTDGMFALAAYDRRERRLLLARDRIGEKPLFYGRSGGVVLFGSELKALRAHPSFDNDIDRDALSTYMRFKYVPAPRTIYRGILKLPPGTVLEIDVASGEVGDPVPYWDPMVAVETARSSPFRGSFEEAVGELESLLTDSVRDRLVADVPVGAFLSGGIDSTAIVATAAATVPGSIKTFTVGYDHGAWDEAGRAADLAGRLGTDHRELRVSPADVLEIVPHLPTMYDEPFGDSSQLPTHLVSSFARTEVTVALSGDGGDELFGGYNRHVWAPGAWRQIDRVPVALRARAGRWAARIDQRTWDRLARRAGTVVPPLRHRLPGQKVHKLARALEAEDAASFYRDLLSHWRMPDQLVLGGHEFLPFRWPPQVGFAEAAMQLDLIGYLPDDILQKVDRASMAVALEARVPYLAHPIVEFAWRLPLEYRIQGSTGKRILRALLDRLVPGASQSGPKMGFGVPVDGWLRGELKGWAQELVTSSRAFQDGLIDVTLARTVWRDHQRGANRQYELWTLLMFLSWYEEQRQDHQGPGT